MVVDGSRLPKPAKPASSSRASDSVPHDPYKDQIGQFRVLKRPDEAAAMALLKQVASQVKPIMKKRGWRVGTLEEFFPSNSSLLGLNTERGQKISIRLRPHSSPSSFYPLHHCIGTMLHELAHIIRGPHDAQFYAALDELEKEHDALLDGGYNGEGFEAPGRRVGQGVSHDVAPHAARERAVEAAEKRRRLNSWGGTGPGGGRKLGGALAAGAPGSEARDLEKVLSPREMAAWAAERRAQKDREWCGSEAVGVDVDVDGDGQGSADAGTVSAGGQESRPIAGPSSGLASVAVRPVESLSSSSNQSIVRAAGSGPPSRDFKAPPAPSSKPSGARATSSATSSRDSKERTSGIPSHRSTEPPRQQYIVQSHSNNPSTWTCPVCTLSNPLTFLSCDACGTLHPNQDGGHVIDSIVEMDDWSCARCTLVNASTAVACDACGGGR
ncbi:WLM-domain-containing protein [Gonapodya prolifera JEL478]|uniref:WLM-domain-containing protein n=1 Tax=Gonapodya prolifera (strain JEL478) TaxID=1344416 RepID=A0A139AD38_GONPJ|nr:WLM-domain-containing protein [Gonapodya prolifera JEL478]|eukprot:KXS14579.1 WLM-domain-containing protein [Gonapodya prolifera JEL478]